MIIVLMGVSGSGKTTIGNLLAECLGTSFADADDYHPSENKKKMAAGSPLSDEDRQPWLETLNGVLHLWSEKGESGVLACSSLKEKYRATLVDRMDRSEVSFVLLEAATELLSQRLETRIHEFMSAGLLDSQLAALEKPEGAICVVNDREPRIVVADILAALRASETSSGSR